MPSAERTYTNAVFFCRLPYRVNIRVSGHFYTWICSLIDRKTAEILLRLWLIDSQKIEITNGLLFASLLRVYSVGTDTPHLRKSFPEIPMLYNIEIHKYHPRFSRTYLSASQFEHCAVENEPQYCVTRASLVDSR